MPELPSHQYNPEELRRRLLEAVHDDRWLPIINPPYDFREVDPRKAAVLAWVSNILGRLAVAVHADYEEIYRSKHIPLLKEDRGRGRFQYITQTDNPAYYYLIHLKGTTQGWLRKGPLLCQHASFALIPETSVEFARRDFIKDRSSFEYYHTGLNPRFESDERTKALIATRLVFDRGMIVSLEHYSYANSKSSVINYQFDLEGGNVNVYHLPGNDQGVLNQDGLLRSGQDSIDEVLLDEALMGIAAKLPLAHSFIPPSV